jgi:hypothetical protein
VTGKPDGCRILGTAVVRMLASMVHEAMEA